METAEIARCKDISLFVSLYKAILDYLMCDHDLFQVQRLSNYWMWKLTLSSFLKMENETKIVEKLYHFKNLTFQVGIVSGPSWSFYIYFLTNSALPLLPFTETRVNSWLFPGVGPQNVGPTIRDLGFQTCVLFGCNSLALCFLPLCMFTCLYSVLWHHLSVSSYFKVYMISGILCFNLQFRRRVGCVHF